MYYAKSTGGFYSTEFHGDAIPEDAVEITDVQHIALIAGESQGLKLVGDEAGFPQLVEPSPPTIAEIQSTYTAVVQQRLDSFAKTRGYDGILSAVTYASSAVPRFAAEGQYALSARDATWAACYEILSDVQSNLRPLPTLEELVAELPPLTWPV